MFQIMFTYGVEKFVKQCKSVPQKDRYLQKLNAANIEYDILGRAQPQLCKVIFIGGSDKVYTYVRVDGDAEAGNFGLVDVIDSFGKTETKKVVIVSAKETTVDECRKVANALGYKKLGRIKQVWPVN